MQSAAPDIDLSAVGGEGDLLTVFMPTGIVPPTGFICFLPRSAVTFLSMSVEEAAKIVLSGGIVVPDIQVKLKEMSAAAAVAQLKSKEAARGGKV